MTYFGDPFDALVELTSANLDANIAIAAAAMGITWDAVDFSPQNGHFITEDIGVDIVHMSPEAQLPCLAIYLNGAQNTQYMMGNSFSGPVYYCLEMHIGSESNDQIYLHKLKMAVAQGMFKTIDSMDPIIPQTWNAHGVAYSRGLDMKIGPSMLFDGSQWADYTGNAVWLVKISFNAKFNLIRI